MKKFAVIYGENPSPILRKATELISAAIQEYTFAYPVCLSEKNSNDLNGCTKIYIGTKSNCEYIRQNSKVSLSAPEEYRICVSGGTVVIEGSDDSGVLYGCSDFLNKYIVKLEYVDDQNIYHTNPFEKDFPDFELRSKPAVRNRGIWTWGHVIYDYRAFFDNMVRLKLNTVTIWNDFAPFNLGDIVEYAHKCGIKIICGYSWFWDTDCSKINTEAVESGIKDIIKKYEDEYLPSGCDGIYFQSFTELNSEYIGDVLIAEAVTDFVNKASEAMWSKYPELELWFGLHANSVKEKLEYIKKVNPKVKIVWENCGAFPFHTLPCHTEGFDGTMDFVGKIANLRGDNDNFGVVTKSIVQLQWSSFEHLTAPANIGVSTNLSRQNRSRLKNPMWKYVQSFWLAHPEQCAEAVAFMSDAKGGDLCISALVEDGLFEEKIMFPVALYAEVLWNPHCDIKECVREVSLRNYVEFA